MYYWFKVLTTPSCWPQNESYSTFWNAKLNMLLDTEEFTDITQHTAKLGNTTVWIANHPYASFTPRNSICSFPVRPSRRTILKAHDKLMRSIFEIHE